MEPIRMKTFESVIKNFASISFNKEKPRFHIRQCLRATEGFSAINMQALFLLYNVDTNEELMDSIYMTAGGILIWLAYLDTIVNTEMIYISIDEIENIIYERLKYPRSRAMFEKTNRLAEKITKLIQIVVVHVSVPGFVLPKAIYSYFVYFTTDFGVEAFVLPIPTWFPFDWKSPIGYLLAVLWQTRIISIPFRYVAPFMSHGITTVLFSFSFVDDIKGDINAIQESVKLKRSHEHIYGQLSNFIQVTSCRRLARYMTDLYQIPLLLLFLGCTGAVCIGMLMIQISLVQGLDSLVLFESIFCGFWALALVLVACEACQRITDKFSGIDAALDQIHWYLLPLEIQRMLPAIIAFTQEPVMIKFFGSSSCTRDQFKKVMHATYNYFMVFRSFYK